MKCKWCNPSGLKLKNYKHWTLFLAESQFLLGWCHAVLKRHVLFFEELTDIELIELKKIVKEWKHAVDNAFKPDWYNIMQLGNKDKHIHFQLVPRYRNKRKFAGKTFVDTDFGDMVISRWKIGNKRLLLLIKNKIIKLL